MITPYHPSDRQHDSHSHSPNSKAGPRSRAPATASSVRTPQSRFANAPTSRAAWRRRLSRVHSATPGVTTTLARSAASTALSPLPHQQWPHRSHQRTPRTPTRLRPRVSKPHQLHHPSTPRNSRIQTPATPSIMKSPERLRSRRPQPSVPNAEELLQQSSCTIAAIQGDL